MTSFRPQRVGDQLQGFVADQLRTLHNPVLQLVTITHVDVSPDLKSARIFWALPLMVNSQTVSADTEKDKKEKQKEEATRLAPNTEQLENIAHGLQSIVNLLRRRIGDELQLRYVPQLRFIYDDSSRQGSRIDYLLQQAKASSAP